MNSACTRMNWQGLGTCWNRICMYSTKESLHIILQCSTQLGMRSLQWLKGTRLLIQPATPMLWQKLSISTRTIKVEAMSLPHSKSKKTSWLPSQSTKKRQIPNSPWTLSSRPRRAGSTSSLRLITNKVLISSQSYLLSCPKKTFWSNSSKPKSKICNHETATKSNRRMMKRNRKWKFSDSKRLARIKTKNLSESKLKMLVSHKSLNS